MNKNNVVSEKTLLDSLEKIKITLNKISADEARKMIFMNLKGLFNYITDMNYTDACGQNNIKNLFDTIAPYIPVSVSEESLAEALKSSLTMTPEEGERIDESFVNYSKIRFLNRISLADKAEWEQIKSVCLTVRGLMENASGAGLP